MIMQLEEVTTCPKQNMGKRILKHAGTICFIALPACIKSAHSLNNVFDNQAFSFVIFILWKSMNILSYTF